MKFFKIMFTTFVLLLSVNTPLYAQTQLKTEEATFAMGCFWCAESEFRDHDTKEPLPGILSITVGYAGGTKPNPTYEDHEGYKEAVKITYQPSKISYQDLLSIFWKNIDPYDSKGQFCDKGFAYQAHIFYTPNQKSQAIGSIHSYKKKLKNPIFVTAIEASTFYDAEEYHQNYASKNPRKYAYYRWNCGRDKRLREVWGSESNE